MSRPVLGLSLTLDERGLPPATAARVHLVVELSALGPGIERARPPLSVILAIDVSGSMVGPPLDQVVQSTIRLVGLLDPTDRVGIVAFSDGASEVMPLLAADEEARRLVTTRVRRLTAEGGTHMEGGLRAAAAMMPPRGQHERQVILLLSDGAPNRGRATAKDLAEICASLRPDIGVSTLGYGPHHHEDVLRAISDAGAGRYHFIADPSVCEFEFAQAIGAQGDVVAEAIEIALFPEPGVEIVRFLGSPEIRFGAGGLKVGVPDLLDGSRHLTVAELDLSPPKEPGPWKILRARVAHRRAGEREPLALEETLTAAIGVGERAGDPEARALVLRRLADEVRAEARALADRGQFEGAAAALRQMIRAIEGEPWFTANDGSRLAETVEQLLDEAMAMERKPSQEQYQVLRKSQLGISMSTDAPAGPMSSPMSRRVLESVAGALPPARLVIIGGEAPGRLIPLTQPRVVIGRTPSADIRLFDANVSRQHAMILGQGGRFLVMDLGSSNPTLVNGKPLHKPWPLAVGDLIQVGDIELRYEEG